MKTGDITFLRRFVALLMVVMWAVGGIHGTALAAGSVDGTADDTDDRFFMTTYYWRPGTNGDLTVEGRQENHSIGAEEAIHSSSFAGILTGEKWNGNWGMAFDLLLIALEAESRVGGADLDAVLDTSMTEFHFLWRALQSSRGDQVRSEGASSGWAMDLIGGVRHTRAVLELEVDPGTDASDTDDWVEPYVGGRLLVRPSRKWMLGFRMDAGGFGMGSASELTWNLSGGADYRLGPEKWVQIGYRALGIRYEGEGGQTGIDMLVSGPMVAIRMDF